MATKWRRRWMEYVAFLCKTETVYKMLAGKREGNTSPGRQIRRLCVKITLHLKNLAVLKLP
jgi:hypothetical protein